MRRAHPLPSILLLVGLVACQPGSTADPVEPTAAGLTHIEGLGSLSFPNSGTEAAQEPFLRGVLLLHSFEYEPAAEAFREAQEADPDFALAYWGEAMTYNHPLWREKDVDAAMEALGRLAPTPEERRAKAPTEREKLYLDAAETLYAEGTKEEQDRRYMEAMERLHEEYPEDHEARAFYALSILGSENGARDFATYMRAAATADRVFEANPEHPGGAHYLIHSFDDPVHAPLGLPAAEAYADIAPNAAHAQHMTTHIFVAMGMWEEVVDGNIRAMRTQDAERAERGRPANVCGHYSSWRHYGHLMLGELETAEELMDRCHERMSGEPDRGERSYFVGMRGRHLVDTEDWALADRWRAEIAAGDPDVLSPDAAGLRIPYEFGNAFAALRAGDPGPARTLVEDAEPDGDSDRIHLLELRGLLALHDGRTDAGIELLREAAAAEDAMPYAFGPPAIVKPTFELLGEELLKLGRAAEAAVAFRRAVERTPGRPLAIRRLEAAREAD